MRYQVQHNYRARRDGQNVGPYEAGTTVELADDEAAWINRDSPGCLVAVEEIPAERAKPARDRMVKGGRAR